MVRPRVVLSRHFPDNVERKAQELFVAVLNPDDRKLTREELSALCRDADGLLCTVGDPVDAALIGALPDRLRVIASFSVGVDHIDVDAAKARGITVTNTPDVLTDATADIAILLMLGAARRASEGDRLVREGLWQGWTPTHMMGSHVSGKRLGIVGMGRIGLAVAKRAMGFDMTVHCLARRVPDRAPSGITVHTDEERFLKECDVLSLHIPLTADTRGWLNAARIAKLPEGAIVVNTARGEVVDEAALIDALRSGRVAAAGLDVFAGEPRVNPGLRACPNTFLLPHLGSATTETRSAMGYRAIENLQAFFEGRTPRDVVGR